MQKIFQSIQLVIHTVLNEWRRQANLTDFVWLARFRLLSLYSAIKFGLLLSMGILGLRLHSLLSHTASHTLLTYLPGIALAIIASTLVLLLGLGFASRFRMSRFLGISMLVAVDICILLAVMYAGIVQNMILLLLITALISCTTPLLVERISRYAKRYTHNTLELIQTQYERELLMLHHSKELSGAIENERSFLKRELHDGLLQELSALQLRVGLLLRYNKHDDMVQLSTQEVKKLEGNVERAISEARKVMQDLQTSASVLEKRKHEYA
jgi:signal transduction histidine kinase